jgi:hypothetical protein
MICPECGEVMAPGPLDPRRPTQATAHARPLFERLRAGLRHRAGAGRS